MENFLEYLELGALKLSKQSKNEAQITGNLKNS